MALADPSPETSEQERRLIRRLCDGDEGAFDDLVGDLSPSLLRVARSYVPNLAVAEEVVQETWLGVVDGLHRFEGRAPLRSWIFRILINRARTRGERERRTVPFATFAARELGEDFVAVDPGRFLPADHDRWPHHWAKPPQRWSESPERALEDSETMAVAHAAIDVLPTAQRLVVTMRDLEGWPAEEVCEVLELSAGNQRVLLHRARSKLRAALEQHLIGSSPSRSAQ